MSPNILAIPALNDNYIWMIVHPTKQTAIIVDPGESKPVLEFLKTHKIDLSAILITHHHWDHTNGIEGILKEYTVPVYGPENDNIPLCDHPLKGQDQLKLPEMEVEYSIIDIPGHTKGHIAYHGHNCLFTGDALFTGGCGRLFEGTPDQLYHSLATLAKLDPETHVYCGHEYTGANLRFAEAIEPENLILQQRISDTEKLQTRGIPTVPSTIKLELQTNPFLRCHLPSVQNKVEMYCGYPLADNAAIFAALRRWKDTF